jgi:hypothetical protein
MLSYSHSTPFNMKLTSLRDGRCDWIGCECQGESVTLVMYNSYCMIGHPVVPWPRTRNATDCLGGSRSKVSIRRTAVGESTCTHFILECLESNHDQ